MKYQIIFHPLAKIELFESKKWYTDKSHSAVQKFQVEISTLLSIIKEDPQIFQFSYGSKRKANLKKFPYSIVFAVQDNRILIYSIFHNSRNPKIWRKR